MKVEQELIDAAWRVSFAASKDTRRPNLGQVVFDTGWVWATDSYRIAAVEVESDEGWRPFSLPAGALFDLTERPTIRLNGNDTVDFGGWSYPSYPIIDAAEKFLPPRSSCLSEPINRDAWLRAIKERAVDDPQSPKTKAVTLHGRTSDTPPIKLNARFLMDGVRACPAPYLRVAADRGTKPVALHSEDFMYVLMPARLPLGCERCWPGAVRIASWQS